MARLAECLASAALVVLLVSAVKGQDCSTARSCDGCIQVHRDCFWCLSLQNNASRRCQLRREHIDSGDCLELNVVGQMSSVSQSAVTLKSNTTTHISANLRPGGSVTFTVTVERQANFPVDLFYILDTTEGMGFNLVNLQEAGGNIFQTLGKLTNQRRIGLGVFNDKPISPFFNQRIDGTVFQSTDRCGLTSVATTLCGSPTSFTNVLPLTTDISTYTTAIRGILLSQKSLADTPKGQLDALLQAAVCTQEIGWSAFPRGQAIRIILLATDGFYHTAGDGVAGGLLKKHDGRCHLDDQGVYDFSTKQDYPSPGQVKDALDQEEILTIFAVAGAASVQDPFRNYVNLETDWGGRALVVRLTTTDNTTFLDLILNATMDASELANLQLSGTNLDGVSLTARARCPFGQPVNPGATVERCNQMRVGSSATFDITLQASDCARLQQTRDLQVFVSPAYGVLNISLNALCDCGCSSMTAQDSAQCSNLGNQTCGLCACPPQSPGDRCQCNQTAVNQVSSPNQDCRAPNAGAGDEPCNGQGVCEVTGACRYGCTSCNANFHGRYCQCANTLCNSLLGSTGIACGGIGRGRCRCDPDTCTNCNCECFGDFVLNNVCDFCTPSDAGCRAGNRAPCSGRNGVCRCGTCTCTAPWTGPTCSVCPAGQTCPNALCTAALACINAPLTTTGCPAVVTLVSSPSGSFDFPDSTSPTNVTAGDQCTLIIGSCRQFFYTAVDANNNIIGIVIDPEQTCSESFNEVPVVLGIVFGLLGLAILILVIWKIVTFVLDRREYRQFLEAQKNAKWEKESNPLFKSPTQKFINPDYKGQTQ